MGEGGLLKSLFPLEIGFIDELALAQQSYSTVSWKYHPLYNMKS